MKNLFLSLLFLGFFGAMQAQVVELKEARVILSVDDWRLDPNTSSLTIKIPELYAGEFSQNPLKFIRENFDVANFVAANKDQKPDIYSVAFKTSKGHVNTEYDKDGNLLRSNQLFKDVYMPYATTMEILKNNPGSFMVSNKHVAYSKEWNITKEYYKVKLEGKDGKQRKTIKINVIPNQQSRSGLAYE